MPDDVSFDFTIEGIRREGGIGPQEDLGWDFTNESNAHSVKKLPRQERDTRFNPLEGTLAFTLTHSAASGAQTDTGTCSAWASDGTCTLAHSWGVRIILVRADPMDLVTGPWFSRRRWGPASLLRGRGGQARTKRRRPPRSESRPVGRPRRLSAGAGSRGDRGTAGRRP